MGHLPLFVAGEIFLTSQGKLMDRSLLALTVQIKSARIPSSAVRAVEKDAQNIGTTTVDCNEYCQLECKSNMGQESKRSNPAAGLC